jgi:hypothetical protein
VTSIVDRVVGGGEDAAVSAADAAWLVEAMARSDAVADAAWDAMATLCATGDVPRSRVVLTKAGAIAVAVTTLERDSGSVGTVVACLRAVANWCGDEIDDDDDDDELEDEDVFLELLCNCIVETDLVRVMLDAMMFRYGASADVALSVCVVLSRLGRLEAASWLSISDYGAVNSVWDAMSCHRYVLGVQLYGCATLSRIGSDDYLTASNAVEQVVKAMRRFIDHPVVQRRGCAALASCCPSFGCTDDEEVSMVQAVLSAMRRHPSIGAVQQQGCATIQLLVQRRRSSGAEVMKGGGCEVVVTAMRMHPDHRGVQSEGAAALYELVRFDIFHERRVAVIAAGGREAVSAARDRHGDEHVPRTGAVLRELGKVVPVSL